MNLWYWCLYIAFLLVHIYGEPGAYTYDVYSYIYIAWYELVPVCNSSSSWNLSLGNRVHTTTKLHQLKTDLDASRGEWRCKQGASIDTVGVEIGCALVAFEGQSSRHTQTDGGSNNILCNKPTLWANVLGMFSQVPAYRRPFDNRGTSSLGSDVWLFITTVMLQSEYLQKEDASHHHVSCGLHFDGSFSGGGQKHAYLVRLGPKTRAL